MSAIPTILGPRGLPLVDLGGTRAWRQFTLGDITCSLQWVDLQQWNPEYDEEGPVPCMCLYHSHRRALGTSAYVIPQSKAFRFIRSDGMGPTIWFHNAVALAQLELGFGPNDKSAQHRIIDIIKDHITDLFDMPSQQPAELELKPQIMGIEATVKVNGKTVKQELI